LTKLEILLSVIMQCFVPQFWRLGARPIAFERAPAPARRVNKLFSHIFIQTWAEEEIAKQFPTERSEFKIIRMHYDRKLTILHKKGPGGQILPFQIYSNVVLYLD
jgi:hypothetical protein